MKHTGVIGYPLGYSLSPAIYQAAFDALGIDARYETWRTTAGELKARVAGLRDPEVLGANVTIPHKEAVIPLLDRIDDLATRVGAVNTIVNDGGALAGANTDVAGFDRALRTDAGYDPRGHRTVVLGAGGAARAIVIALLRGGARSVLVSGRTPERHMRLVSDLRPLASTTALESCRWLDGTFLAALPAADLVVNCTPVGTSGDDTEGKSPVDGALLPADGLVFDIVYNPPETPLLRAARERGARTEGGLGMLVYQAAESLRMWTGRDAPVERMLAVARETLGAGVAQ